MRNSSDKEAQKKKRVFAFILALLVLAGCGAPAAVEPEDVSQSEVLRYALDESSSRGSPPSAAALLGDRLGSYLAEKYG